MLVVVIREIVSIALVAYYKQLNKTEQWFSVAIPRIVFVIHDLLHGTPRTDIVSLQFDLYNWNTVNEQNDIVTMVTVIGIHPQLVDYLVIVFAPIFDINQRVL